MKKDQKKQQNYPTKPSIKYVKKAQMWARSSWKNQVQTVEWFKEEPK